MKAVGTSKSPLFSFRYRSSYCRTFSFRYNDFYFNTPAYNCLLSDAGTAQVSKRFQLLKSSMYCKYLIVSLLSCKNCLLFAQTFELSSSWDIYEIVNRGIKECRGDSFGGRDGGMMFNEMEKKSAKYDIATLLRGGKR